MHLNVSQNDRFFMNTHIEYPGYMIILILFLGLLSSTGVRVMDILEKFCDLCENLFLGQEFCITALCPFLSRDYVHSITVLLSQRG